MGTVDVKRFCPIPLRRGISRRCCHCQVAWGFLLFFVAEFASLAPLFLGVRLCHPFDVGAAIPQPFAVGFGMVFIRIRSCADVDVGLGLMRRGCGFVAEQWERQCRYADKECSFHALGQMWLNIHCRVRHPDGVDGQRYY